MTTQIDKQLDPTVEQQTSSFLEQAIGATKQTEASRAEELIKTLTEEAMKGTVSWNKNLTVTFREAITLLDQQISEQLSEVMHHPELQKLEGSWRGLNYLVMNSETSSALKIRMISMTKKELHKDLSKAVEFDQSQIFKKVYESEFGSAGGEPYGALIGDYEFTNHPEDIESLRLMSNVAASGFSPFLSAASPASRRFFRQLHRLCLALMNGRNYLNLAIWIRYSSHWNTHNGVPSAKVLIRVL